MNDTCLYIFNVIQWYMKYIHTNVGATTKHMEEICVHEYLYEEQHNHVKEIKLWHPHDPTYFQY